MALGPKRSTCPAGCQGAEPMQTVIPVNQLRGRGGRGCMASTNRRALHLLRLRLHGERSGKDH